MAAPKPQESVGTRFNCLEQEILGVLQNNHTELEESQKDFDEITVVERLLEKALRCKSEQLAPVIEAKDDITKSLQALRQSHAKVSEMEAVEIHAELHTIFKPKIAAKKVQLSRIEKRFAALSAEKHGLLAAKTFAASISSQRSSHLLQKKANVNELLKSLDLAEEKREKRLELTRTLRSLAS
jgi:uncharacterized protein YoxC